MEITEQELELFMQFKQFMGMKDNIQLSTTKQKKKRREKGTGSIVKLSGSRKRPYMATWTTGYNDEDEGQQIQAPLAYFKEYEQANKALDLYMLEKDGRCAVGTVCEYVYNVDGKLSKNTTLISQNAHISEYIGKEQKMKSCHTFEEIWKIVLTKELYFLEPGTITNYKSAFHNLKELHKKRIADISLNDIQPIFDDLMDKHTGFSKMNFMKIVINYIYKYACKYDLVNKNYAQFINFRSTLDDNGKREKIPYSKDDIKFLFQHDDDIIAQSILIMIYTGMRPSELLKLKKEDIHIKERYMVGGIKTSNGKNRCIPIHECIVPYIENLLINGILELKYYQYKKLYDELKEKLKFKCTPHSGRHTFATLANEYGLNEFLLKKIMGHSAKDLTKDVYTHVDAERLIKEINKIPILK